MNHLPKIHFPGCLLLLFLLNVPPVSGEPGIVFEGGSGAGHGKHIVWISGDEEYRSEEALPMLAKILSKRYGFRCTVLFAVNRKTGEIDPNVTDNIPGLAALETADLMFVFTRFRDLPDEQMKHVDAYLQTGKPVIGIRPSVVAFRNKPDSKYAKYSSSYRGKDFTSGFGRQVLGATWISHHGHHGRESTRGIPVESMKGHPIMRGVGVMWGRTDVYTVRSPIPHNGKVLVMGQTLKGMKPDAPPSLKAQMPLAWIKHFPTPKGNARVFMSTMGDAQDFRDESFRRMVVNACFWAMGLEDAIGPKTNVDMIVPFYPLPFGFNGFRKGQFPRDYAQAEPTQSQAPFTIKNGDRICYVGNTLADRMQHFGWLETLVQSRFAEKQLVFRNLGFPATVDELRRSACTPDTFEGRRGFCLLWLQRIVRRQGRPLFVPPQPGAVHHRNAQAQIQRQNASAARVVFADRTRESQRSKPARRQRQQQTPGAIHRSDGGCREGTPCHLCRPVHVHTKVVHRRETAADDQRHSLDQRGQSPRGGSHRLNPVRHRFAARRGATGNGSFCGAEQESALVQSLSRDGRLQHLRPTGVFEVR